MEDYVFQQAGVTFPVGVTAGTVQCCGIPIIDNERVDNFQREFSVSLFSFSPLISVIPFLNTATVLIVDDDGEYFVQYYNHVFVYTPPKFS